MWQRRSTRRGRRSSDLPARFSVVEPGTATLRLLIVEVTDEQSTVWGWAEGSGLGSADVDPLWLSGACEDALARAEGMAQELGEQWLLPDQILVGLPASLLRGWAWPIAQRRLRPEQPIDEAELEGLLTRALRLAVNRLRGSGPEAADWFLVDAVPVTLSVDGRGVTDPIGFRGQEIGATVFAALARRETIEAWGFVARELEFSSLTLTAAPLALAASLGGSQAVLMDIGGATTDLIWCRAGRPVALDSVPTGGVAVTHALSRQWNLTLDRAERLKRAYVHGDLTEEGRIQVQEVIAPALRIWLEEAETAMARMNKDEPLPQHIYLAGGGSALPHLPEAARSLAWSQRLQFSRYPQVRRLLPGDVPGVINRTGRSRELGDVSALALAAWASRSRRERDCPMRIMESLCHEF